jgi:hypothetical protein
VEEGLWPLLETILGSHDVAGLAVAVVREDEVVSHGFGARDLGSGAPVTPETMFHLASAVEPAEFDLDDEGFTDAVWGAIELHRTSLVWPLLRVWTELRPDSSAAWTMTGWAQQVDGHLDLARSLLRRALDLDPENHEAALIMSSLPSA